MDKRKIRVAISHGDINGIGYEVILKALSDEILLELMTPVIYGSCRAMNFWQKELDIEVPQWIETPTSGEIKDGVINLVECCQEALEIQPGQATHEAGIAAFRALEEATRAVLSGRCQVLVTAPINKSIMPRDLFPYAGHTQYLEAIACLDNQSALMLLTARECRVALVTDHLPLERVASSLSQETIVAKVRQLDAALRRDYGVTRPRIAVLGLNPHAGDRGVIGNEEQIMIIPSIAQLQEEGYIVFGPYPSDGFWGSGSFDSFDGIVAMYHDQGLAPFKALYMDEGVNTTLGLRIVRTSPDHGTGYDIAGKGVALPCSMRDAIYDALDIYRCRLRYDEANRNPLKRLYHNRSRDDERIDFAATQEEDHY